MNGKTIQVDNTDAEGRLILADGLCYAHKFDPSLILDIATLTGAIAVALGSGATGVCGLKDGRFHHCHLPQVCSLSSVTPRTLQSHVRP